VLTLFKDHLPSEATSRSLNNASSGSSARLNVAGGGRPLKLLRERGGSVESAGAFAIRCSTSLAAGGGSVGPFAAFAICCRSSTLLASGGGLVGFCGGFFSAAARAVSTARCTARAIARIFLARLRW
jgi:hypothetical protein